MNPFTFFISASTVLMQMAFVAIFVGLILKADFISFLKKNASIIIFILYSGATIGSLIFEHVLNFPPCPLCWYQRIFIYSSAILLARSFFTKRSALPEVFMLSIFGLVFAVLHNILDIFQLSDISFCTGSGSTCLIKYVYSFGYITIPMMSLTILALGILLSHISRNPQASIEQK